MAVTHNTEPIPARGTRERGELVRLLEEKAKLVRRETVRLSRIAGAGHYTGTFSCAELFSALYYAQLRFRPDEPGWADRDRFMLSKGHAAIGLYPVLADLGFFEAGSWVVLVAAVLPGGDAAPVWRGPTVLNSRAMMTGRFFSRA